MREPIVGGIEALLREARAGATSAISLRITGCPNGCARTYAGDIGLVGRMPGVFAIFVGGDFEGTRLSFLLHERVPQSDRFPSLDARRRGLRPTAGPAKASATSATVSGRDALLALPESRRIAESATHIVRRPRLPLGGMTEDGCLI